MKYKIGQKVKISTGTFKGSTGIIRGISDNEYYFIEFDTNTNTKLNLLRWYPGEITEA